MYISAKIMNITTTPLLMRRSRTEPVRSSAVDAIETLRFVSLPCLSMRPATNGWKITERMFASASVMPIRVLVKPFSSRKTDAYAWIPLYTAKYVAFMMIYLNVQKRRFCVMRELYYFAGRKCCRLTAQISRIRENR